MPHNLWSTGFGSPQASICSATAVTSSSSVGKSSASDSTNFAGRPDDTLHLEIEVLEVRPSKSRPDQGVIKVKTTPLNQSNQPVQVSVGNLIVRRRLAP